MLYRACLLAIALATVHAATAGQAPNIVFILTDDQDVTLGGLEPMVKLKRLVQEQGVFFDSAFVHTPICCPSRSSYLTGRSSLEIMESGICGHFKNAT